MHKGQTNSGSFKKGEHRNTYTEFKKGQSASPATQFKSGVRNNPNYEFPKGIIPWNKGRTGVYSEEVRQKISNTLRKPETPIVRAIRDHYKMKEWINAIYLRDNYTCQKCRQRGGLHAHHIKGFILILREHKIRTIEQALTCKELWDISNGETLCWKCHRKTHKKIGNFTGVKTWTRRQ